MSINQRDKCIQFLTLNGWTLQHADDLDYITFSKYDGKHGLVNIDITENEIVFVDDWGEFLYLPINYYALIGALIEFKQIAINYKGC